ncbi:hypothetical protein GWI33_004955 [Rhynchophorus ferrugineus]|uniref:4-nitrophenylphosphatase n=1 Tax=Rhynchophorus ferrugineus TaxID=354439 RepID=A0A834MKK0_RHYFE|nr:hypothetical protein GWI33_004955 [Rhynchophorus ferrugineus]
MKPIVNLAELSPEEGRKFVNSIDYVFSDMDGVLFLSNLLLEGSDLCIEKFRQLGKHIAFVTNNTFSTFEVIKTKLQKHNAREHEVITPPVIAVDYLKSINCPTDIYCIGGHVLKDTLTKAGYNIVDIKFGDLEESMPSLKDVCFQFLEQAKDVGAIVLDLDVNFKLMQAEGAILLLTKNPNMEFLCVATDLSGPLTENIEFIGNRFYVEAIERISKKKCTVLGKPSIKLKDFLTERFNIESSDRVLFIGDA